MLETSEKLIAMGIGAVGTAILMAIAIVFRLLPDQSKAKRLWVIVIIPGFIVGSVLLIMGLRG